VWVFTVREERRLLSPHLVRPHLVEGVKELRDLLGELGRVGELAPAIRLSATAAA
jgi:hypothetical protein